MSVNPELLSVIPNEGIVLVGGGIRSGKSTLAYGLLEEFHVQNPTREIVVLGLPKEKAHLLPAWANPLYTLDFPDGAVLLADEAYLLFHSRSSSSEQNKFIDKFCGLVGQKRILTIYVTQTTRKLDLSLVSGSQVFLLKKPSRLMMLLDRAETRKLLRSAFEAFQDSQTPERDTYVIADKLEGLVKNSNSPPEFWSDELSRAWAGVGLDGNDLEDRTDENMELPDYQAIFQSLAVALQNSDDPAIKLGLLAIDRLIKGEQVSGEIAKDLQGCIPLVNARSREMIRGLVLTKN